MKTLALILAGGEGSRLGTLTDNRAKPAMPYAGTYRLIDFSLSNCMHSGISNVWVVEQYEPHSLNDHLANGRPWDLDRTYGGLRVLPPFVGDEGGFAKGNADAIFRNRSFIREFDPDVLLVLSADHVYKLDYSTLLEAHQTSDADLTVVTKKIPLEEAHRFGTVEVDGEGRVTQFKYKPENPSSDLVVAEIFAYKTGVLLDLLERFSANGSSNGEDEDSVLKDFGDELLPQLVQQGLVREFRLETYWQDLGTPESYWKSHMDLLDRPEDLQLDDPAWPIFSYGSQRLPARIAGSAHIENSLISPGCDVRGRVIHSVLAPGVIVEAGAVIQDTVLLQNCVIRSGAQVTRAVVDERAIVGSGAEVIPRSSQPLVIVPAESNVPAGQKFTAPPSPR